VHFFEGSTTDTSGLLGANANRLDVIHVKLAFEMLRIGDGV
jgi:hypothetical protein